jgi:putative ABC transport system permease protein
MDNLVLANLKHRPARTAISVIGVALGVCLTMLTLGLVHGMIRARAEREANIGAEIMVVDAEAGGVDSWASLRLPVREVEELQRIEGVKAVVPVGQYFITATTGIGIRSVEGVPTDQFRSVSHIQIIEGRFLNGGDEAVVDTDYAEKQKAPVGSQIDLFGRPFRVVGVYTPESGPRIKIPLDVMQQSAGNVDQCSTFLIRVHRPEEQDAVAQRIQHHLGARPRRIILTRDLPAIYAQASPAINTFLDVVVGLEAVISILVILLTMYTTIKERTREIGILKSLGASKRFIAGVIEKEAFVISLIGVIVGLIVSYLAGAGLRAAMDMAVDFRVRWLLLAVLVGLVSGLVGALYPALLAARQDPIEALSYE